MDVVTETRRSNINTPVKSSALSSVKIDKINHKVIINDEKMLSGL